MEDNQMKIVEENRKDIVNKLINYMEQGEIPWKKGWNSVPFRMHNPVTHKGNSGYRGINSLILMMEAMEKGYKDPRWMTFKQAQEKGLKIKEGSKSTRIEYWSFGKEKEVENKETGEIELKFVPYKVPQVSYYRVFNAEQIEGIGPLNKHTLDLSKDTELDYLIKEVRESSACPIEELDQGKAYYSVKEDKIVLPMLETFESKQEFLSTMIHEMGHSTGHESRLNRDLMSQGGYGSEGYALEELRAELSSVFLQDDLGINLPESSLQNNSAYIKSWIEEIKNNPNALFDAIKDADKISQYLSKNIELSREKEHEITNENENKLEQGTEQKRAALDIDISR